MPRSRFSDDYMRQMHEWSQAQRGDDAGTAASEEQEKKKPAPEPPCIKTESLPGGIRQEWRTRTIPALGQAYLAVRCEWDADTRTRKIFEWRPL